MPTNHASRSILQKRGFREEGYAERYLRIAGKWEDHLLYGLTLEEWRPSWRSMHSPSERARAFTAAEAASRPAVAAETGTAGATEGAIWTMHRSC
jgi:hypothetical protein